MSLRAWTCCTFIHIYIYVCVCVQVPALRQELASIKEKRLALLKDYQALNLELKRAKEETSSVREVRRDTAFVTIGHTDEDVM